MHTRTVHAERSNDAFSIVHMHIITNSTVEISMDIPVVSGIYCESSTEPSRAVGVTSHCATCQIRIGDTARAAATRAGDVV